MDLWCPWIEGGGVLRSGGVRMYEGTGAGAAHSDLFGVVGVFSVLVGVVGAVSTLVSCVGSVRGTEGSGAGGLLRSR